MTKAYIIQRFPDSRNPTSYDAVINDIKLKNPDVIFVISIGEIAVPYIFEYLFNGIQDWLIHNNRYLTVLWAGPDTELLPNIMAINTLGSAYGNVACVYGCHVEYGDTDLSNTSKLFTSYNNNAKYERRYIVDTLAQHDLLKDGIVTYRYPGLKSEWKYHDGSILADELDFSLNSKPEFSPALLPKSYLNGFIDIVSETDCRNDYFIPTEKTAKPWGAMKPYLVVSSKNYHKWLLSEYGIEMYTELFDYSFDSLETVEERIEGIVRNLIDLRTKFQQDAEYKARIYEQIKPKLKYNKEMALKTFSTLKDKNKLIPKCLEFITKDKDYELLGEVVNDSNDIHFIIDPGWHRNPKLSGLP